MISAIVLAAGSGTRFGSTKQVELVRGKPLVQHAIDAATEGGADEVVVVLGHDAVIVRDAAHLPPNARFVVNPAHATGIASSLAEGLRALDATSDAVVVLLADQPGVTAAHVRALVAAYRERPTPVARLRFRDGPGPSVLARETWAEAAQLEGDAGARVLIERHPEWVREVALTEDAPADVDEPTDLGRV